MSDPRASSIEPANATRTAQDVPASAPGSVCAALLSAGLGCFLLGLTDLLADASAKANKLFNVYDPTGALSGETTLAVLFWLIAWVWLHRRWTVRPPKIGSAVTAAFVLLGLGLVLTFPPLLDRLTGR